MVTLKLKAARVDWASAHHWTWPPWLQGLFLYLVCLGVLAVLIFATPGFVGNDDYYHARISTQIIEQRRLALHFPWLPETILSSDRYVDHHLLFHLFLAPWVYLGGMAGAKVATVGITAGAFVAAWMLLRGIGVRYPGAWTLMMLGVSSPFLYRLLMIRTQGAALLLLLVTLHILFQRHYRWLVVLAFAFTWLYDGFVLILAFAALYTVGQWIEKRQFVWQPLMYGAAGVVLGLIVNPYFPDNVRFIAEHLGAKVSLEDSVNVGNEWYPYRTATLLSNSPGALLALAAGVLWPSFSQRRRDGIETTLLLTALLTLYMVFEARRFIEYSPAFALLFCAAAWGRGPLSTDWLPWKAVSRIFVPALVGLVALLLIRSTLTNTYHSVQDAVDIHYMAGASAWLAEHTPPGTPVFQTDWDDFPYLFYHNTHNTYLVGLDPTYLQRAHPALWDQWVAITQGRVARPSEIIRSTFGSTYVVSDTRHNAFEDQARNDPAMRLVYRDEYSYVWEITSEPRAAD